MFYVSKPYNTAPAQFGNALQEKTCGALEHLNIPFERVDTDEAITMEDCVQIDEQLKMKMVKTCSSATASKQRFTCSSPPEISRSALRISAPRWKYPAFHLPRLN